MSFNQFKCSIASALLLSPVAIADSAISQVPADLPKDKVLGVIMGPNSETLCYHPVFTKGEGYIYLQDCSSSTPKARYDVFGRISFTVNGNALCITAPSSVTGIDGTAHETWDYLTLRPCALNDENQKFRIVDRGIYTNQGNYRVKNFNYYAYISKNPDHKQNHHLQKRMTEWANTKAQPATLTIKTPIGWEYRDQAQWAVYYLQNNKSAPDEITELYYNPANGHIAQYYPASGELYCLTTKHQKGQEWNWATWEHCTDDVPQTMQDSDKKHYWEFFALNDNQGYLRDYWDNFLRVSAYGANWGVPYTQTAAAIRKDTYKNQKDYFLFAKDIGNWNRFVNANYSDELTQCPAGQSDVAKKRVKRDVSPYFSLTDPNWTKRLWEIARSGSHNPEEGIGVCGTCLLHTFQMALEMMNDFEPRRDGTGYLFNTAAYTDPFISFRQRYPGLAAVLQAMGDFEENTLREPEQMQTAIGHSAYGMAAAFLPNYILSGTNMMNAAQMRNGIDQVLHSPVGSIWINFIYTRNADGTGDLGGHAQPVLRTENGLVYLTTNAPDIQLDEFRRRLNRPLNSVQQVENYLTDNGRYRVEFTQFIRVERHYFNPLVLTFSQNNCTGEGNGRHGNRQYPRTSAVNQCATATGRCGLQSQ